MERRAAILPTNHRPTEPTPIDSKKLALVIADVLHKKQGTDIAILDVSGPLVIADYFVVGTARNARHAKALALEVEAQLRPEGRRPRNAAGLETENPWVLLDYDDVVVHVFLGEAREFYALESLWADVPRVPFTPSALPDEVSSADSQPDPSLGVI